MFLHTSVARTEIDVYLSSTIAADTAENHNRAARCGPVIARADFAVDAADAASKIRIFAFVISARPLESGQKIALSFALLLLIFILLLLGLHIFI